MEPPLKPGLPARLLTILILATVILGGCNNGSNPIAFFEGHWVSGIPFTYSLGGDDYTIPHDNRIYESANFLVFSDASGDEVKKTISIIAELKLRELKEEFDISSSAELGIVGRDTKVIIYANKNMLNRDMQYFPCGMILFSLDSRYWQNFDPVVDPPAASVANFPNLLKHESMHVFQHLLGLGLDGYDDWPDIWFTEGLAEYVSGGSFFPVNTMGDLVSWYAIDGHINPISIHKFLDYPVSNAYKAEYYPMFHLALRYLLSERGAGKNLIDVKMLFEGLKDGQTFAEAFETHMGMSLDYFEDNFYDLIVEFL